MAADLTNVDIRGAYSKHLNLGKKKASTHGGEFWTPCPWCGTGDDRFHVWPYRVEAEDNPTTHWCRICGESSDVVAFIEYMEKRDFIDACRELNVPLNGSPVSRPRIKYHPNDDEAPADGWRSVAIEFAKECKEILWSEIGKNALAWLRVRGLSDDTIRRAGLGYNPATRFEDKEAWAIEDEDFKKVWLPRGIVIPWVCERQLWKIGIRRPDPDIKRDIERGVEHPAKYTAIAGGSNGLYGVDAFNYEKPTIVVEGEFDKLILSQVVGNKANVLATGSTGKGRGEKWALLIAQSPIILVAYDADEAGEKAMKDYWLKYLPQSLPWQPWAKDLNAMYLEGQDLHEWLQMGIEIAQPSPGNVDSVNISSEEPDDDSEGTPISNEQWQNACRFLKGMLMGTCPKNGPRPDMGPLDYIMSLIFFEAYCVADAWGACKAVKTLAIDTPILNDLLTDASRDRTPEQKVREGVQWKKLEADEAEKRRKATLVQYTNTEGNTNSKDDIDYPSVSENNRTREDSGRASKKLADRVGFGSDRTYSPVSLPSLPRKGCPCIVIDYSKKDGKLKSHPCRGKVTEHGFCAEHQLAQELLQIGAKLGYPEIEIPFKNKKQETRHRIIHAGIECWEDRACTSHVDSPQALLENVEYLRLR